MARKTTPAQSIAYAAAQADLHSGNHRQLGTPQGAVSPDRHMEPPHFSSAHPRKRPPGATTRMEGPEASLGPSGAAEPEAAHPASPVAHRKGDDDEK